LKLSLKSSQVNKLIGYFDKTDIDVSRVSQYEQNLGDQSVFEHNQTNQDEAEDRFIQNRKSLEVSNISRSFVIPHKKPTKDQMKKLLAQRKAENTNLSQDERGLKRIKDRSRT
jgi:hypothetical protein